MSKSVGMTAFAAGGGVASKLILTAALVGLATFYTPSANADVRTAINDNTTTEYKLTEDEVLTNNIGNMGSKPNMSILSETTKYIVNARNDADNKNYAGFTVAKYSGNPQNMTIQNVKFINFLSAQTGGVIYNNGGKLNLDNVDFESNTSSAIFAGVGGVIGNYGEITSITGNFINNTTAGLFGSQGGAISNEGSSALIKSINADFIGNSASGGYAYGGAIFNSGTIGDTSDIDAVAIVGTFKGNTAQGGGAISNKGIITNINAVFGGTGEGDANTAYGGSAIYNYENGKINKIQGSFIGNKSTSTMENVGGAIGVDSGASIDYINAIFTGNGAVSKYTGAVKGGGGAVAVNGTAAEKITSLEGTFENNYTIYSQGGGAIYNRGTITSLKGTFTGNKAAEVEFGGGAIGNLNTINIIDSEFTNNLVSGKASAPGVGGAIVNKGTLTITADTKDVTFSGNKVGVDFTIDSTTNEITSFDTSNAESNAIYSMGGTVTFDGAKNVIFNDKLTDDGSTVWTKNGEGKLVLAEDMSGVEGKVYLNSGTVQLAQNSLKGNVYGTFFNKASLVEVVNSGIMLDSINNHVEQIDVGNLSLTNDLDVVVDVDLAKAVMDNYVSTGSVTGLGNINVVGMNLMSDMAKGKNELSIKFTDNNLKDKVADTTINLDNTHPYQTTAYSPIYKYTSTYNTKDDGGYFDFTRGGLNPSGGGGDDFNPAVLAAPAAAQAGAMAGQWNSYDQAFLNMDMNMLFTREQRRAMKLQNKYAMADLNSAPLAGEVAHSAEGGLNPSPEFVSSQRSLTNSILSRKGRGNAIDNKLAYDTQTPIVYSNTYLPERDMAAWARPYTSFETVHLRKGPHVNNTMYGMYLGGDSEMYELKHNWDFQYSVYAGYNGSRQSYDNVTILQNGGTLGTTGIFYHDNFFTGLTVNVGAGVANADTMYGHEDFAMLSTGVASKTGYNWELAKGRFIIQPSWLMSYSFVNTFDYTNAAGVKISSDPLHAIQLAPQLKFIGNLPHGWQPYASVQMVWNIMDESRFKANDVSLPNMSMGPFIQYGVGVQKRWGDRFTGFFQTMFRNGSRTGVAFTLGFRWALGSQRDNKTGSSSNAKRTVIK